MGDPPDLNNPSHGVNDPRQATRQRLAGSQGRAKFATNPSPRVAPSTPSMLRGFVPSVGTPPLPDSDGGVVIGIDHAVPTTGVAPLRVAEVGCILATHEDHWVLP